VSDYPQNGKAQASAPHGGDSRAALSGVTGSVRAAAAMIVSGWRLLLLREKMETSLIFFASFLSAAVELAALSTAVPFVGLLLEPDAPDRYPIVNQALVLVGLKPEGDTIFLIGGLVIASLAVAFLFRTIIFIAVERFSAHFANRLVDELIHGCLFGPYAWLRTQNGAHLAQRISVDAASVGQALFASVLDLSYGVFILLIGLTAVIAASSWMTIGVLIGFGLLAALILAALNPLSARYSADQRHQSIKSVQQAVESLSGAKVLKASRRERYFLDRFATSWRRANFARMKLNVVNKTIPAITMLIGQIAMLSLAMTLVTTQLSAEIIVAQLTFILLVLVRVLPAVSQISGTINRLVKLEPFYVGYSELLSWIKSWATTHAATETPHGGNLAWHALTFEGVEFRYADADRVQLKNINLTLERGRSYAFVGASGAGKSTLLDILLGLLIPTGGVVRLDEKPLTGGMRNAWLSVIGYVPQEPFIIDDSLRRNVAFGLDDDAIDNDRIWQCLELAELADVVKTWPAGLETSLGDAGGRLSGGQRQRAAIARALYGDPQVLVFDEATSALDVPTERDIRGTISRLGGERTIVTITHRMGSLADCDKIFVLEDGAITASGSHEALSRDNHSFRLLSDARVESA